jgi:hypothetical protein
MIGFIDAFFHTHSQSQSMIAFRLTPFWLDYKLFSSANDFSCTNESSWTNESRSTPYVWLTPRVRMNAFRVRVTLRLAVYRQSVRLGAKPLKTHGQFFFFRLNTYCHSPYVTSSLTSGWVCRLQFLLVSPAQSFSGQSSAGLMTTFYCFRFETPPT